MRRFVADASHELRTPLAATGAYAELFERGAKDRPEDLGRAMAGIRTETARMAELVDDLLLLAQLDEGRPLQRRHGRPRRAGRRRGPRRPCGRARIATWRSTSTTSSWSTATPAACARCSTTCSPTSGPTRRPGRACRVDVAPRRRSRRGHGDATTAPAWRPTSWPGSPTGSSGPTPRGPRVGGRRPGPGDRRRHRRRPRRVDRRRQRRPAVGCASPCASRPSSRSETRSWLTIVCRRLDPGHRARRGRRLRRGRSSSGFLFSARETGERRRPAWWLDLHQGPRRPRRWSPSVPMSSRPSSTRRRRRPRRGARPRGGHRRPWAL